MSELQRITEKGSITTAFIQKVLPIGRGQHSRVNPQCDVGLTKN